LCAMPISKLNSSFWTPFPYYELNMSIKTGFRMSEVAKMSQASSRMSPIFIICKKFTIVLVLLQTAVCCNNPLFESLFVVLKSAFS
jgi:hypothetical protein